MGWDIPWYTITDGFDTDFGVDEWHGHNAFIREGERVFRTGFINSRGDEGLVTTWNYLTSPRSDAKRTGRTLPALPSRTRHTNGGTGTTANSRRPRLARPEVGRGVGRRGSRLSPGR